jgi:hypothetical protein
MFTGLGALKKWSGREEEKPSSHRDSNCDLSAIQPVAIYYAVCAIPALGYGDDDNNLDRDYDERNYNGYSLKMAEMMIMLSMRLMMVMMIMMMMMTVIQ